MESEVTPADPDKPCQHQQTRTHAVFETLTDQAGQRVSQCMKLRSWCEQCEEPMRWNIQHVGFHPTLATVEGPERLELRVPCDFVDNPLGPTGPRLWVPGQP